MENRDKFMDEEKLKTFEKIFVPSKIGVILESKNDIQKDMIHLIEQFFFISDEDSDFGFLLNENIFIPYLSLTDNLFLGKTIKEKEKKNMIKKLFPLFELDQSILMNDFSQCTQYEKIKLQLLQLVIADKKKIIIEDVFANLSIFQRQALLPLLQSIVSEQDRSIVLFTTDRQVAESCYVQTIFSSIAS